MKTIFIALLYVVILSVGAQAEEFHGHPCTKDCSGHKAGYAWAQKRGITDPDECSGKSNSFVEGCRSWAQEQEEAVEENEAADEYDRPREGRWY